MKKTFNVILGMMIILIFSPTAMALETKDFDDLPTAEEISRELFPEEETAISDWDIPRGIGRSRRHTHIERERKQTAPRSVSIRTIQFDNNSTELTSDSYPALERIAETLKLDENAEKRLLIEGHADASGSKDYNKILSQKRARAVKEYLASTFEINPNRLAALGKGSTESMCPNNAGTSNRRVVFHPID